MTAGFNLLSGVSASDTVPRVADADHGRQGALSPGGEVLRRQSQHFEPTEGKVGREDF